MNMRVRLLPTEEERSSHAADWPGNERYVERISTDGAATASGVLLQSAVRELMQDAKGAVEGCWLRRDRGTGSRGQRRV